MKPSILRTESGVCYICRRHTDTALHHIFGASKRTMSDENGFTVFLCPDCHQYAPHAVHRSRETSLMLKARCQKVYEKTHGRDDFSARVGRNYL